MKSLAYLAVVALISVLATPTTQAADAFPTKPIRLIVNTAPGGFTDIIARLVAQHMGEYLKQPIVVENRAGGDGLIGIRAVKSAPADGYTMLAATGTIAQQTAMRLDPGYELPKDFTSVGILGRAPYLMVVGPTQPDKTAAEFVARAKASPGKLTYASAGVGTVSHFAIAVFLQQAGVEVSHIPYKGNAPALPDVMSGRVDTIFETYPSALASVKSGKFRVLGVTSATRLAVLPDVPTLAEQVVPNYSFYTWVGIFVPAGAPKEVLERLSQAIKYAKATAVVKDRFRDEGMESVDLSQEQLVDFLTREVAQSNKLVKELKIEKH